MSDSPVIQDESSVAKNTTAVPKTPIGCFMVQGALSCSADADPIRRMLAARRNDGLRAMRRRFTHAVTEGDLPRDTDAADLARYLATVSHGLAVQAASGASRKELTRVAEMAMRAWPV